MWHLFCQSHLSTCPALTARRGERWEAACLALPGSPKSERLRPAGPQGQPPAPAVWAGGTDPLAPPLPPTLSSLERQAALLSFPGSRLQLLRLMAARLTLVTGHTVMAPVRPYLTRDQQLTKRPCERWVHVRPGGGVGSCAASAVRPGTDPGPGSACSSQR